MLPPSNVLLPKEYWQWASKTSNNVAPGYISKLKSNEVFVFGANKNGFHGAGKVGNQYRLKNPLLFAPDGTRGFWAVKGIGMGFQIGNEGKSYAICTILNPGSKRSIDLLSIKKQVEILYLFATINHELTFYVTKSGDWDKPSLNGYTLQENASCYLDKL